MIKKHTRDKDVFAPKTAHDGAFFLSFQVFLHLLKSQGTKHLVIIQVLSSPCRANHQMKYNFPMVEKIRNVEYSSHRGQRIQRLAVCYLFFFFLPPAG